MSLGVRSPPSLLWHFRLPAAHDIRLHHIEGDTVAADLRRAGRDSVVRNGSLDA